MIIFAVGLLLYRFSQSKTIGKERGRPCRIEELEGREMLSITLFNAVNTIYTGLELGAYENYNIIEIAPHQLDDIILVKEKINEANSTANKSSLIIAHTTENQNTIEVSGGVIELGNAQGVLLVGLGTVPLTIDGSKNSGNGIFATTEVVTFAGLTITNGMSESSGGAIFNTGTLTVLDCTISNSTAKISGGGIYTNGTSKLENCIITGNKAYSQTASPNIQGGGIFSAGTLTVVNCEIVDNYAESTYTGIVTSPILVRGGGIFNSGLLNIVNSTVAENRADCLSTTNSSGSFGGGIYSYRYDGNNYLTIENSTIAGNYANEQGGIGTDRATIVNCLIAGNMAAPGKTAGVEILTGTSLLGETLVLLTNNTIAGNYGIGFHAAMGRVVEINNSIIAHNRDYQYQNSDFVIGLAATVIGQHNLIGMGDGQNVLQDGQLGNIVGTKDNPSDPKFISLEISQPWSSGLWKSWDFNLDKDSPAIDAGNDIWAVNAGSSSLQYDHKGNTRFVGEAVDIGAFEYNVLPKEEGDGENKDDTEINRLFTPSEVKAITATISSLYITWNKVENTADYKIEYATDANDFAEGTKEFISEDEHTITYRLIGLPESETAYQIRVVAISAHKDYEDSDYSLIASANTATVNSFATAAIKPKIKVVKSIDVSSVTLTWKTIDSNAVYQIACNKLQPHEFTVNYHFTNGMITGATINGLSPNTSYRFTVTAMNSQDSTLNAKGKKNAAATAKAKTPKLVIPKGIKIDKSRTSLDRVTLFWRPPASETSGYTIIVRSKGIEDVVLTFENGVAVASGSLSVMPPTFVNGRCELVIGGLQAATKYTFFLQAFADGVAANRVLSKTVRVSGSTLR